ncbi:MAG: hypothetical protein ACRDTM_10550 [Micromonosporaceae bacterium]
MTCSTDVVQRAAVTVNSVRLATLYTETGFNGSALTYVGAHACSREYDREYRDPSFDNPFWNNNFESVKTYTDTHCDVKLFGRENFGGDHTTWIDRSYDLRLGGENWQNRASSLKIS